ncbi:MAG: class I SAM-dependent methyltransferase [Planctomycetota bacterium]|nr:class I SAM-dependent methyltransferase [Planctomycetota bacterium]
MAPAADFGALMERALEARRKLLERTDLELLRVFHGETEGMPGVFVERLGVAATLIVHEGVADEGLNAQDLAEAALRALAPRGVRGVYHKPFLRHRPGLKGAAPAVLSDALPLAGESVPEAIHAREHERRFEIRPYDGFSTGLFLDQRETRDMLARWVRARRGGRVLNTFAYTCGFSVATALGGARTTSVDVSGRYLDWGKRNFALNGLDAGAHAFARMDTFEYLAYAERKGLSFDLIVLDPPTFSTGDARRGRKAWSAARDYPALLAAACERLARGGAIFASTNATELCRPGALRGMIRRGLGKEPRWLDTPGEPADFPGPSGRSHWAMFEPV